MLRSGLAKKRAIGIVLLVVGLALFLTYSQLPQLNDVHSTTTTQSEVQCFQGYCIEVGANASFGRRWADFSLTYLKSIAPGMTFAFLITGIVTALLVPPGSRLVPDSTWLGRTLNGVLRRDSKTSRTGLSLSMAAVVMAALVFTPVLGVSRIVLGVAGALFLTAVLGWLTRRGSDEGEERFTEPDEAGWLDAAAEGLRGWSGASIGYLVRLGPLMVGVALLGGLVVQWVSPEDVEPFLGNNVAGVVIAAAGGLLLSLPLMFEIGLVAFLLILGMGEGPATALLSTAAIGGPLAFRRLARTMAVPAVSGVAVAVLAVGLAGGAVVWGIASATGPDAEPAVEVVETDAGGSVQDGRGVIEGSESEQVVALDGGLLRGEPSRFPPDDASAGASWLPGNEDVKPFVDVANDALAQGYTVWNDRPGVAVFDFDRDGDLDFYLTQKAQNSNYLYRNDGTGMFTDVAEEAGVALKNSHSTGVVACDVNNDGYQDLYVGAWPDPDQRLDFRSVSTHEGSVDHLLLNNGDGTFRDVTNDAFGDAVNVRAATTVVCADVDNDGWLDIFVGNLMAQAFRSFGSANHPGHYSVLYRNNGDGTFSEIAEEAGVRGPEIVMRAPDGRAYLFTDPATGSEYEAWDATLRDAQGNVVGEPTGQNHSAMFFDYDDDGDVDLFLANDGDRFRVFRNDSVLGKVAFTEVSAAMGIDQVGAWMGFAIGDIDADADLDVFVTNMGYHPYLRPPMRGPSGSCEYHMRFLWGTCLHYLLRNDGVRDAPGIGTVGVFVNAAPSTNVVVSPWMPPHSLDPTLVHPLQQAPTGLAAYDFGYGTTFFDFDNDGCPDLYWLGSDIASGQGPGGDVFPSAGRLLRGDCAGGFTDVTVEARVLDIIAVNYAGMSNEFLAQRPQSLKISNKFHENGKGVAHGDLNGDGYVDLIGTNASGPIWEGRESTIQQAPGPTFVWMNAGGERHWISLRLVGRQSVDGTGSNADGIGARVYVTVLAPDGSRFTQVQEVRAGSSYLSMDSVELEFGLGNADRVEEVSIFWPSGIRQMLTDVEVDQVLRIVESSE